MRPAWKLILPAFLAGCLLGAAAGSWCQRIAFRNFWAHGPNTGKILAKLSKDLALDAKQKDAVKAVLDARRSKVMALHREMGARMDSLRLEMRGEIRKILNPDQQKKLEEMSARWDARHKRTP